MVELQGKPPKPEAKPKLKPSEPASFAAGKLRAKMRPEVQRAHDAAKVAEITTQLRREVAASKEKGAPVTLREIKPADADRMLDIEATLDPDEITPVNASVADTVREVKKCASPVPFVPREKADFSLIGVSNADGPDKGKLAGWVSVYEREEPRKLIAQGLPKEDIKGKEVVEFAYGKDADATVTQMAAGMRQAALEVLRYHVSQGKSPEDIVITSDVKLFGSKEAEEMQVLREAGFVNKGVFDLRDKDDKKPDEWHVFMLASS